MTAYFDILSLTTPGTCANCGAKASHLINGCRCRTCHEYRLKCHVERPARLWQPVAPVWAAFQPTQRQIENGETWCDCGQATTVTLTVPISGRGKATLLLCDDCAALEKRLAPCHSWAGS